MESPMNIRRDQIEMFETGRQCEECGGWMNPNLYPNKKTCSVKCRVRKYRRLKNEKTLQNEKS
jgi:hypothetical protein